MSNASDAARFDRALGTAARQPEAAFDPDADYVGVTPLPNGKWRGIRCIPGSGPQNLGCFQTKLEAAQAYAAALGSSTLILRPKKVERTCERCGSSFFAIPSVVANGKGRFCSRKCFGPGRRIVKSCEHCGEAFSVKESCRNPSRFCSRTCHYASRRDRIVGTCGVCGTLTRSPKNAARKYCSTACAIKGRRRVRPSRVCEICGGLFHAKPYLVAQGYGRFCSRKCVGVSQLGRNSPAWKGGWTREYRRAATGNHSPKDVAALLRIQRWSCPYCEADLRETGFQRDHIIPLKRGGSHYIGNIQLLCPPCNRHKFSYLPVEFRRRRALGKVAA